MRMADALTIVIATLVVIVVIVLVPVIIARGKRLKCPECGEVFKAPDGPTVHGYRVVVSLHGTREVSEVRPAAIKAGLRHGEGVTLCFPRWLT